MAKPLAFLSALVLFFLSCGPQPGTHSTPIRTPVYIDVPTQHSGEPNLFVSDQGIVYLSWIEHTDDSTVALQFSTLEAGGWTNPLTIASGTNWFINWADFPSLLAYKNDPNALAAHWLQKSGDGTYDYDVRITQSSDGGKTWGQSFVPYDTDIPAEYGFVSMLPLTEGRTFATWLDGRNTKRVKEGSYDHGHGGPMSLRVASFDREGNLYDELELDKRVCDCCQTSAAMTDKGPIVAYRDRSHDEIRDIYFVRQVAGKWTSPKAVFNDGWQIHGCPVNGPSVAAKENRVVIAWFTMSGDDAQVKAAFSDDSGDTFGPPVLIDNGKPLGRVDVVLLPDGNAMVSWLEETDEGAEIRIVEAGPEGKSGESMTVSGTDASRRSGFPVMVKDNNRLVMAWTLADSITSVRSVIINL